VGVLLSFIKAEENSYAKPAIISIHVLCDSQLLIGYRKKNLTLLILAESSSKFQEPVVKKQLQIMFPMVRPYQNLIALSGGLLEGISSGH